MQGNLQVYTMTEEERLAYIKKHPIKEGRKFRKGYRQKFPYEKAIEARWGKKNTT